MTPFIPTDRDRERARQEFWKRKQEQHEDTVKRFGPK